MKLKNVDYVEDIEEKGDEFEDLKNEDEEVEKHEDIRERWKRIKKKYKIPSYKELTKGWFSLQPLLDYNRHLIMSVGMRSSGKSTGASLWLLLWFLEKGQGWIYSRRDKDEVDETGDSWFDNAVGILNSYITDEADKIELVYTGRRYYVWNELAGIAVSLKKQQKLKSKNLSWVKWQVYDEAITMDGKGYIGGMADPEKEYDYIMSLRTTADRDIGKAYRDEVVVIVLANNESFFNPIYMATGADKYIRMDTHFLAPKGEEWVIQQMRPEDSPNAADYKETVAYKLASQRMRQRDFENYNDEQVARNKFIKKIEKPMKTVCNFHYDGYDMQVKVDYKSGLVYICKGSAEGVPDYALTLDDHRPNYLLILTRGTEGWVGLVKNFILNGLVYFENDKCWRNVCTFYRFIV